MAELAFDHTDYNTQRKRLALPEYGRNIQNMVDHCLTIEDRDERNRCARTIIDTMGNLFPHLRDISDYKHILWDHLAIMSGFKLDIDSPYEMIQEENLHSRPKPLDYPSQHIRFRHYGAIVQELIKKCVALENGNERDQLERLIANQMKKSYIIYNKEVDDQKICEDLYEMSGRQINIDPNEIPLIDTATVMKMFALQKTTQKKKKK